jgi:hypothetical protein
MVTEVLIVALAVLGTTNPAHCAALCCLLACTRGSFFVEVTMEIISTIAGRLRISTNQKLLDIVLLTMLLSPLVRMNRLRHCHLSLAAMLPRGKANTTPHTCPTIADCALNMDIELATELIVSDWGCIFVALYEQSKLHHAKVILNYFDNMPLSLTYCYPEVFGISDLLL